VRRLFWVAVGATVGVLVVRKVSAAAHGLTPAGMADRAGGVGESARGFAERVRTGMAEREAELRDALGLDGDDHTLGPEAAADIVEHPSSPRRSAR
jgi:hypothetical protein